MHCKFLNSVDVDKVLVDGTMMVSSLNYFRQLEAGDIGDPLEGATELTIQHAMTLTEGSPELASLNAANIGLGSFKQFAKVESGGRIDLGPMKFIHLVPEMFIYSFSVGDLATLTEEMCVKASLPYDACLVIEDPGALGRACYHEGTIMNLEGRRVSDVFERLLMKKVDYVSRSIDIREGSAIVPDPFKKGERFRPQSEMRLVFLPRAGCSVSKDRLIIALPGADKHFKAVFRSGLADQSE